MDKYIKKEEVWKDVKEYEGVYQASNLGNVRSSDRVITTKRGICRKMKSKILKPSVTYDGYHLVGLCKSGKRSMSSVHRIVARTFLGEGKELEVNHIDGDKTNNSISNLEYVTISENMKHSFTAGLRKNKLRPAEADEIRYLYFKTDMTQPEIAKIYGVSKQMISSICLNKKW